MYTPVPEWDNACVDVIVASLAVVAALIGVVGAWMAWRARTLEQFRDKASGATHALSVGNAEMAAHLTGEAAPRAAGVRSWVRRLGPIATEWVDALEQEDLPRARAQEDLFVAKARWLGFAR